MGRPKKPRTKEHYYQAAKKHGYRARSAYKIRQMIDKYDLLKGVNKIIELCSNPGGWTQVLREYDKGLQIVAVDLERMPPLEGVKFIQGDITDQKVIEQVEEAIGGKSDLVLSDCSPKVSGQWELDVARQLFLAEKTIEIALSLLGPKGKVVTKLFQGVGFQQFLQDTREKFRSVRLIKPPASRQTSAEIYLLAAHPK
jgi:23S rRNA (uridine2552-2'-O)-methyltransferase